MTGRSSQPGAGIGGSSFDPAVQGTEGGPDAYRTGQLQLSGYQGQGRDQTMSNRDRIAEFIRRFPGRDDDEISAALRITPRQTVNQVCRALENARLIERRPGPSGKLANYPAAGARGKEGGSALGQPVLGTGGAVAATIEDWFWEGNVTNSVAKFLIDRGWAILSQADTATRERGVDLHVKRGDSELVIEAKGYPSKSYRDPRRASERKPTNPTLQAQHWYAHALLKALRLQSAYPSAVAAMAFPDFPRYRALFQETEVALARLGVAVLFVDESGAVEAVASSALSHFWDVGSGSPVPQA